MLKSTQHTSVYTIAFHFYRYSFLNREAAKAQRNTKFVFHSL